MEKRPLSYVNVPTRNKDIKIDKPIQDCIIYFYRTWGKGYRRIYDWVKINKTCLVLESGAKIPYYKISGYIYAQ